MTRLKKIISFYLFFQILFSINLIGQLSSEQKSAIDKIFLSESNSQHPGACIAIVQGGKVLYTNAFGLASLEHGTPNSISSKFHIADLAYQFVAFSALKLAEEGKINLEDDIRKYLPELPEYEHKVQVKHLMNHSHGLASYMHLQYMSGLSNPIFNNPDLVLNAVSGIDKLLFKPGERFAYGGTGFVLLTKIIERVSEKSLADYAKEKIFDPLKMNHSSFMRSRNEFDKKRVTVYNSSNGEFGIAIMNYHKILTENFHTTAEDMAKWLTYLFTEKSSTALNNFGKIETIGEERLIPAQFVDTYRGVQRIHQNGLAYGNMSYMCRFPESELGIIILSNLTQFPSRTKALEIVDFFLKDKLSDEMENAQSTALQQEKITYLNLKKNELKKFEGHYWEVDEMYGRRIYLRDDTLRYFRSEGNENAILPIGKSKFRMLVPGTNAILDFSKDGNKKLLTVTINNSYTYRFENYSPANYSEDNLKSFSGHFFCEELGSVYHLNLKEGKLVADHFLSNGKILAPVSNDHFTSPIWYFSSIRFQRNEKGEISGFKLESPDVSDLWFRKI